MHAVGLLARVRLEQLGRHHRGQGQRDEGGDRHRRGQRHRQFAEQAPGVALEEADRQEHRHQHRGGGDHREGDLRGAAPRRHQCRFAQVDATLDVLHHHDRIVHHQADAQHQGEQGQQVDREAERIQRDERGHQAHRHRHRRDQRRAHAAQEQPDHHQHQHHRLDQGVVDAFHRGIDEHGGIEGDEDLSALGQGLLDLLRGRARGAGHIQAVGGGGLDDAQADVGHAVAAEVGAALGRGQFHLGHVAQPHHVAVAALAERNRGEIRRCAVAALHAQGEVAVGRLQAAGRQFHVLAGQRVLHVGHGEVARGQLVAVQPDPHRIALAPAQAHLGHAIDAGEPIDHVAFGVVG
ncbi:hypothetical protein NB706_003542 [Xanthomonas sacchari]|nr:hypothetical protein [Xanthomonas sacchari]